MGRSILSNIKYTCTCPSGFTGINCEDKMCLNGGTSYKDGRHGSYKCKCSKGFSGAICENNIDECANNPCHNGATCLDLLNERKCVCRPGFTGTNCEKNIDDCTNNPCANGGKCHDLENGFYCECKVGFHGKYCSKDILKCQDEPCMNGGVCKNLFNDYKCKCPTGFSGKDCHIDPHGNVMRRRGDDDTSDNTQKALIATFATIIPALVIIACALILCKNRRYKNEQKKADAEAKRENELNAVTSVNKSKMLDDHMIVNQFECKSKTKRNVNEHQEDFFNSKDVGTYKQMVSPQYVPHSNVNSGVNKKLMNTEYKQHSVAASSFEKLLNDSKDNFSSSGDTYSSTGTCVTSSSSSAASSTTSSQYIPESTYSRSLNLTANGRHTHLNVSAAPASQFNDCASTVSSCSR